MIWGNTASCWCGIVPSSELQCLGDVVKLMRGRFWWTALVSFASVAAGGVVYSTYLRMVRGHLVHWPHEVCDGKKEYQQVEMEEREEAA